MKKLNNRGFLLVETVIVSVFVLTIFVMIYQNSIPMIDEYNQRFRYDDMNSIYGIDLLRTIIINDPKYPEFLEEVEAVGYKNMTDCSIYSLEQQGVCNVVKEYLGIESSNRIYLTIWELENFDGGLDELPRGFLEYVKYLSEQEKEKLTDYRLIYSRNERYTVEFFDENVTSKEKTQSHYANIGL